MQNFDLDDFNIPDMNAMKVLEALSKFNKSEFAKGEQIHKKKGQNTGKITSRR